MEFIQEIVTAIRQIRSDYRLGNSRVIPSVMVTVDDDRRLALLLRNARTVMNVTKVASLRAKSKMDDYWFTVAG